MSFRSHELPSRPARRARVGWLFSLALFLLPIALLAQGVQTGTLRGSVGQDDGSPLPGVTVTATSPALQGSRTVITDNNGEYILRALPAGTYEVTYSLDGLETVTRPQVVQVGVVSVLDQTMGVSSVDEVIVVQATVSPLDTSEVTYNISQEEVDELAVTRDLDSIADLAPGLTLNTPNGDQATINGAFAYDNVWLMEGVEINNNLFGSFDDLFIEDAIDQTQVLTSGISAEYGRFSGGVVNVTTKRGGNTYSGSLRVDYTNNDWQERNQFEKDNGIERTDVTNDIWQATLGGKVIEDRLWFFAAGRQRETADEDNFDVTGIGFDQLTDNDRYEIKLTGNIADRHTISAGYMENDATITQKSFSFSIDPNTVFTSEIPNDLRVLRYAGTLTDSLFAEAHYSEKQQFSVSGGDASDVVDSPFISFGFSRPVGVQQFNAPYFDATDPESRDNEQLAASLSIFQSTGRFGSHDVKVGVEDFTNINVGGNSQSSTGLVFLMDYEIDAAGNPVLDANGRLIPVFETGFLNQWIPERGSRLETNTQSLYVNDRWQLNDKWAFNLGVRYEQVDSEATGDIVAIDTERFVPRLGATYDLFADGRFTVDATFGQYSGGYNGNIVASNSGVTNPSLIQYFYVGPPGSGRDFAPGFDLNNYVPVFARFPSVNVSFEDDLKSPITEEWTVGFGAQLGRRGFAKVTYVDRDMDDFIEDFITFDLGQTTLTDPLVLALDNQQFRNTDVADRKYKAVQIQARYQITDDWSVQGNYTHQIENEGNYTGEATNQPGNTSLLGNYPEIVVPERNVPYGRLAGFQEHKVRVWSNYDLGLGAFGRLNIGGLVNYDSGLPYSLSANFNVPAQQLAGDPGYANPPTNQALFFGGRGTELFEDLLTVDLALRYARPIGRLEPWLKVEIFNLLNEDKLVTFDTSISPNGAGPVDANGLPTTFTRGPNFGQATDANDYADGREFRLSLGVRF